MPDSTSEAILKALLAALEAEKPAGVELLRNDVLARAVPAAGLAILRDGDPGEPEYTLSPLRWHWTHEAELDLIVTGATAAARDAALDALRAWVSAAVSADRTLGGLCDWVEAEAPRPADVAPEEGEPIKAATVAISLHYATTDSLI